MLLHYIQQLAVSSMATRTLQISQFLVDIPGYGYYCDAQKIVFYLLACAWAGCLRCLL